MRIEGDTAILCPMCIPFSCCPTVKKIKNNIVITDDYDESITIDLSDCKELVSEINELLSLPSTSLDNKR